MTRLENLGRKTFCAVRGHTVYIYNSTRDHTVHASCSMCRQDLVEVNRIDEYKRTKILLKHLSTFRIRKMTLKGF